MESLYVLVPLSVLLVFAILGVFAWALFSGQFDEVEREGGRILEDDLPENTAVKRAASELDMRQPGSGAVHADSVASGNPLARADGADQNNRDHEENR